MTLSASAALPPSIVLAMWLCSVVGLWVWVSASKRDHARLLKATAVSMAVAPLIVMSVIVVFPDCSTIDGSWWWWNWCWVEGWY